MLKSMAKGILWIGIGLVMIAFDVLVTPVFQIPITDNFGFPVAVLAIIYGVLALISNHMAVNNAQLTHAEIAEWGEKLEKATPRIIQLSGEQWSSEAIVETIEQESKIPQHILIKYMYAIRGYLRDVAADGEALERRGL